MSKSPLISIIVPCYNHARFLPRRLESISKQTIVDFEVILLDDASSDSSQAILRRFKEQEPRVSVADFNPHNGGYVNDQWIKGVDLAKGDFVWIAESDDAAHYNFLEVLLQQFEISPSISMAYSDSVIIDESGTPLRRYDYSSPNYEDRWQESFVVNGKNLIKNNLVFYNVIPNVSAVLFRKIDLRTSLQKTDMKYCADWICYVRILANSSIAYVNQPLNFFRTHAQTTRQHDENSYKLVLLEKKDILREIKSLDIPDSSENISSSFKNLVKYRHKFKRIKRLSTTLSSSVNGRSQVALYGSNEVCEYLLADLLPKIRVSVIFDNNKEKEGTKRDGIVVKLPTTELLANIDIVVLCSFSFVNEMQNSLRELQFRGDVLIL